MRPVRNNGSWSKAVQSKSNTTLSRVLLLHGLYTSPSIMRLLGRRLHEDGFEVHYFGYASVRHDVARHAERLRQTVWRLSCQGTVPVHLVGHSLGGLVVRSFVAAHPDLCLGRCVTLGTPHQGSVVAHCLYARMPYLLGLAYGGALDGQVADWPAGCEWGSVAGSRNKGVGRTLGVLKAQSGDGTVALAETQLPSCHHHWVLPVSHTAMLFDRELARQTGFFLRHGHFDDGANTADACCA